MITFRDKAFNKFASKLADRVLVAINTGVRLSAGNRGCHCPLGCLAPIINPGATYVTRRPTGQRAKKFVRFISDRDLRDFAYAFDTGARLKNSPYSQLALMYRAKFP